MAEQNRCVADGAPFGSLDLEHVCISCGGRVCAKHSDSDQLNPDTGETGRSCELCRGKTIEDDINVYVAHIVRGLRQRNDDLMRAITDLQRLVENSNELHRAAHELHATQLARLKEQVGQNGQ